MNLEKQVKQRIFGLDVVRALAIALVVFSHLYYLTDNQSSLLLSLSGLAGYLGVEIFFVLSGFLIGTILLKQFLKDQFSIRDVLYFLKRRWYRTLPNYYLVLGIVLLIAFFSGFQLSWKVWRYFFFLQNFEQYSITIFVESWSLSVEEWTYFLVPVMLFFVAFLVKSTKKVLFITTVFVFIVLFHFFRYIHFLNDKTTDLNVWGTAIKSVVIYRVDAILYGFVVAWVNYFYTKKLKRLRVYFLIVALHLLFFQYVVMNVLGFNLIKTPLYYQVFYFSLTSITIAMLLPFFVFWEKEEGFIARGTTFVSKISYSIYLLHYSVVLYLLKDLFMQLTYEIPSVLKIIVYLFSTLLLSYFLYRFYEKPMMDLRNDKY
ncbi:acyltransferase [Flavobacterium sp. NRK F10]|uniref:acyltransferase family protein n=1 Tax=Flavobacterium sp. NRK F10 TaxID=2954931 RepID=UPI002091B7A9|nr:acyltransferase [Flavobacterium sp. NRK F10]MCO6174047.1 acyltransferase [Flavobacterium sp. NRK F10]